MLLNIIFNALNNNIIKIPTGYSCGFGIVNGCGGSLIWSEIETETCKGKQGTSWLTWNTITVNLKSFIGKESVMVRDTLASEILGGVGWC